MTKETFVLGFTLANSLSALLITLSVALIGFTVTFAKDFQLQHPLSKLSLVVVWLIFLASILVGLLNIKALITAIAALKGVDEKITFSTASLSLATWQEWLFFIGLFLFIVIGCVAFWSRKSAK
jgi:hypothetical protein